MGIPEAGTRVFIALQKKALYMTFEYEKKGVRAFVGFGQSGASMVPSLRFDPLNKDYASFIT